jgi:hypothetical protein
MVLSETAKDAPGAAGVKEPHCTASTGSAPPTPAAPKQLAGITPGTLLSENTSDGQPDGATFSKIGRTPTPTGIIRSASFLGGTPAVGVSVRLFVSPVNPSAMQLGALNVPLFIAIRTTKVDPVLKLAAEPSPLPKILNSAICQCCPRSGSRSSPGAEYIVLPTVNVMRSSAPFVPATSPLSFTVARASTGMGVSVAAMLLLTTHPPKPGVHPDGHAEEPRPNIQLWIYRQAAGFPQPPLLKMNCCHPMHPLQAMVEKVCVLS